MDPQATWNALVEQWAQCNWVEVAELAQALLDWLGKNGFPPETMGEQRMGADWNRVLAIAVCTFARRRAIAVLDSADGIPTGVAFTLACDTCGNEGPDTPVDAIAEGWIQLRYTPAGMSENFLGYCPVCQQNDALHDAAKRQRR